MEWDTEKFDWTPLFAQAVGAVACHPGGGNFSFVENLCKSPVVKGF